MPRIVQYLAMQLLTKKPHYVYMLAQFALEKWPSIEPLVKKGASFYASHAGSASAKPYKGS